MDRDSRNEAEDNRIRREYPTTNTQELANSMGRGTRWVIRRANAIGVKKSQRYISAVRTAAALRGRPPTDRVAVQPSPFADHALPDWVMGVRRHFIADDEEEETETMGGRDSLR